jgi:hypothetical protein
MNLKRLPLRSSEPGYRATSARMASLGPRGAEQGGLRT